MATTVFRLPLNGFISARTRLARLLGEVCITGLVCISLITPGITISSDLPRFKIELLLLPVVTTIYVWLLLAGFVRPIRFNGMYVVGVFFCFAVIISMMYGADILQHRLILRDYYEIPKALIPALFFTVAYEAGLSEAAIRRLLSIMGVAILLVCFYGWAQFVHAGFTYTLNQYYAAAEHNELALKVYRRVFSTAGNPNVLGQILTWTIAIYTTAFLFQIGNRTRNIVIILACVVTLVMTGSRYGLLTSVLALVMIIGMTSTSARRRALQLAIFTLLIPIFAWTFTTIGAKYRTTGERFEELKHPLEVGSLRMRLDGLWIEAADYFEKSPIVGHGPAKQIFTGVYTDSEYLNMLKYYGIVGFTPFLAYYLLPLFMIWKGLDTARLGPNLENRFPAMYLSMRVALIMVVTALVMNIGEFTYLNDMIKGFLWMWMGIGARSAQTLVDLSSRCTRPVRPQAGRIPLAASRPARGLRQLPAQNSAAKLAES